MRIHTLVLIAAVLAAAIVAPLSAHEGIVVGHSPPDPLGEPPCPTLDPLRLFLVDDPRIGSPILPGESSPSEPGEATVLDRLALNALLARPEFGGFVYVADTPGMAYVDPANACHAMTTAHTGGQPFTVAMVRTRWSDEVNFALADNFGLQVLLEDGDTWVFGNEAGGHAHPFWLSRRAGRYHLSQHITSSFFLPSDEFSLSFATSPECVTAVPFDMTAVFNADVVDSDDADTPVAFDGQGRSWLLNGHYGTALGLPRDGRLDVFQLGGPNGSGLAGAAANCLFDDGVRSTAATLDLSSAGQADRYESIELLVGAAGTFTSADVLIVRLVYQSGNPQVVQVRRAAAAPRYFPLLDWQITTSPLPHLAVGRTGTRAGGGFVRSMGTGVDISPSPADAHYFQRVTFPADPARVLSAVTFDDYTGAGRNGVFAITGMRARPCPTGDFDGDGDADLADFGHWDACAFGPAAAVPDAACLVFDFDLGGDVDLMEFAELQLRLGGAVVGFAE